MSRTDAATVLQAGFADPGRDAQRVFRAVLVAMAAPGRVVKLHCALPEAAGIGPAAAAILLTLADADTPVWTDAPAATLAWLRFHAGCPLAAEPAGAVLVHAARPPPLGMLEVGSAVAPQLSATLLLDVATLVAGVGWRLTGPGIETETRLEVGGIPDRLAGELAANHARYPAGIDVIFCAGDRIAALPRSTGVVAAT